MLGYPYKSERETMVLQKISWGALISAMILAGALVACSSSIPIPADAAQPSMPAYSILDRFDGPDGYITLFCRNGDLFVDKNGVQSGSVQFFYKHEKCAGR